MEENRESPGLTLCQQVADFMRMLLRFKIDGTDPALVPIPSGFTSDMMEDSYLCVDVLLKACLTINTYQTPWTLGELRKWRKGGRKQDFPLMSRLIHPTVNGQKEVFRDTPCNVRDSDGRIMCYYLPGILSRRRQRQLQCAVLDLCDNSIQPFTLDPPTGKHWRTNSVLFKDRETMRLRMDPGAACYSPCWLEQGHPHRPPGPSVTLMNNVANLTLLQDTEEVAALMGGILSIIHPSLFKRGMDVWKAVYAEPWSLRNGDRVRDLLDIWATPFTAMSVISNRETPHHRDINGGLNFFDAIMTFGTYEEGRFELPEIGRRFRYDRGTVIFLESRSLEHGASAVVGERCCLVLFFRPLMLRRELPEEEMDPEDIPMPTLKELRAAVRQN